MLEELLYAAAALAILVGTVFSMIGMIGLLRLPDVYARLHAAGKVSTFGVVLLTVAAILAVPYAWSRGLLLIALLLLAGPVVAHAIASAAWRTGVPMKGVCRDDLAAHRLVTDEQHSARAVR
ncbi:MAG: monovalent cation/H(+) antiporter subunit G [Anaerolineae bacterium]|nr:monovalent cation/H(+) antiporter subunit G [Thermoflexales bacterium]MDW8406624.1 monovalent cation/H(+) antiporter subunit G [Anaerolineae bacterium]